MRMFFREVLNLIYPPRCPVCQDILTDRTEKICKSCRKKAVPVREPKCKKCGKPLTMQEQEYCLDCSRRKHFFSKGWAVFPYDREIRQSVCRFKFHNKREYKDFYASEMARLYGKEITAWRPDVILPIPMYRKKQRKRGYNQAELLAAETGKRLGIPVEPQIICRVRNTTPQKKLTRKERDRNLKNAFKVQPGTVNKKKVLLVDDIYTTGATVDAAARALLEQGAEEVRFLALCIGKADN